MGRPIAFYCTLGTRNRVKEFSFRFPPPLDEVKITDFVVFFQKM